MSKVLYLPLKKEWYEMIESGVKTEEYREIKPYWVKRLLMVINLDHTHYERIDEDCARYYTSHIRHLKGDWSIGGFKEKKYSLVSFSYGYTKRTMTFECKSITIGQGRKEWGAPDEDVFIIKLGERIE